MSYNIIISRAAQNDLKEALLYIERVLKNTQASQNLYIAANKAFYSLSELPKHNSLIDENLLGLSNIRYILIKNYITFYTIDEKDNIVKIIRFLYNKREWNKLL